MKRKVYILEGLDCANCAAKMERKISKLPGISDVSITYATRQLRFSAENPEEVLPRIKEVVKSVEPDVEIVERTKERKKIHHQKNHQHENCHCGQEHHHEHHHQENCGCGHEHHHHHAQMAQQEEKIKSSAFLNLWKKPLFSIVIGAVLFVIGEILEYMNVGEGFLLIVFLLSYLILGGKVLLTAIKNITRGQVFDENFLMSIATIGAFLIQEFPEAVGVMLFYRIGEYFEERATKQSRSQIMEAVDLRPEVVNLMDGEKIHVVDAQKATVGDIVLVRPGDRIPLDGIIVEGESRIDTSPVTGEPVPVMARSGDSVISGCVNTSGQLKIRVEKILEESMVTRILDSVENAAASKPGIDRFITRFARVYTPVVVLFAFFVALILPFLLPASMDWHLFVDPSYTGEISKVYGVSGTASVYTALTFLVISCPCALVLSVPLAFFSGIGAGSKRGILFKGGIVIEALNKVKAIVMDKTGTITKGNFAVQAVNPVSDKVSADLLLALSASCELSSTHPIGNSIVEGAKQKGLTIERPSSVEEIAGYGIRATISRGEVLCGNRKLMDANQVDLRAYREEMVGTEVLVALDGIFIGNIVISDTIKEDASVAMTAVKKMGIRTVMLTGDTIDNARKVAEDVGIDEVHARLLPEEKLLKLQNIRQQYGAVLFVGDGINDAPVLAGADVGAAMGSGADAAIEAADVVFMHSEMNAVPEAIRLAKMTNRISWQNVVFALAIKIIVMIMGLFGFANMWIAVFADTGVSVLCLLNSIRILRK